MAFRFFKRVQILPGVYLNFGKHGVSVSIGPRGCKTTIGTKGVKQSIGIPGTGIRYETGYRMIQQKSIPSSGSIDTQQAEGDNVHRLKEFLELKKKGC